MRCSCCGKRKRIRESYESIGPGLDICVDCSQLLYLLKDAAKAEDTKLMDSINAKIAERGNGSMTEAFYDWFLSFAEENDVAIKAFSYVPGDNAKGKKEGDTPLPNKYVKRKLKSKDAKELGLPKDAQLYALNSENCNAILLRMLATEDSAIPRSEDAIIDLLRNTLDGESGIIEVGCGTTENGNEYAFDLFKRHITDMDPIGVVDYTLNINVWKDGDIHFINGSFQENGMTGMRDTTVYEIYRKKGYFQNDQHDGWNRDPYDSKCKEGFLMNLSEQKEFDDMFPDHPLSEARELIDFIITNW